MMQLSSFPKRKRTGQIGWWEGKVKQQLRQKLQLIRFQNISTVEELHTKIAQLESEMEAKVNTKVQHNMAWLLKKLGEANPGLKVDITHDFCATVSSDGDEFGTPITPGTASGTAPGTTRGTTDSLI